MTEETGKALRKGDKLRLNDRYGYKDEFGAVGDIVTFVKFTQDDYRDGKLYVTNSKGVTDAFFAFRFDFVEAYVEPTPVPTIKEQITLAKSLIGKTVKSTAGIKFKVNKWTLTTEDNELSVLVNDEVVANGFCVCVRDNCYSVPINMIELIKDVKVTLNSKYNATVTKETITVGCQTFPVSILKDLQTAIDSL